MNSKCLDQEVNRTKEAEVGEALPNPESLAPMLVEIICERAHCVIYEYAIVTVKFVADEFKGRVKVKPVVRRGSKKNVDRYLELCRMNGQHLSVPAILMGGKLVFTYVPGIEDLRRAMEENLQETGVSKRIKDNLWQVGGSELTDSADAAVYLIWFGDKAALVDSGCGQGHLRLRKHIDECLPPGVQLEYLLLTHCHFDHAGGAAAVRMALGCRIVAHELDAVYLEAGDSEVTAASWYGARLEPLMVDIKLHGHESTLTIGDGSVTAIHWPGHSPGSVVYTTNIHGQLVLFGQDVHGPIHPALLSDEKHYQASLAKLIDLEADILLEGHYGIFWTKEEVREFIQSFMK